MAEDCVFCRLARGEIPAKIVAESEAAVAFRDLDPRAPVHILVMPRRHVASLNEAAADDVAAVMELLTRTARSEGIAEPGYRVVINTGSDGGQTVGHLHAHLLGGRHMAWPPG